MLGVHNTAEPIPGRMKFITPLMIYLIVVSSLDITISMPIFVTFLLTLLEPRNHKRQDFNSAKQIFVRIQLVVIELATFRLSAMISASVA